MIKILTFVFVFGFFYQFATAGIIDYSEIYRINSIGKEAPEFQISPNGRYIVSVENSQNYDQPSQLRVHDLLMRRQLCSKDVYGWSIYSNPVISPNGKEIVALKLSAADAYPGTVVSTLVVFNLNNCELTQEFLITNSPNDSYFYKIIFSNSGSKIAIVENRRVKLFDIHGKGLVKEWNEVNSAAFSKSGNFLFIGRNKSFSQYDLSGALINIYNVEGYRGHVYGIGDFQFGSNDNEIIFFAKKIVSGHSTLNINKLDLSSKSVQQLASDIGWIMPVNYIFSRNLNNFISNTTDSGTLRVFNFENNSIDRFSLPNQYRLEHMSTNYNDTLVAGRLDSQYLSPSSKFIVLDLKSGEVVTELEEKMKRIHEIKFSPTSNQLIYTLENTPEIRVIQFDK